jgi:hypothetical protein
MVGVFCAGPAGAFAEFARSRGLNRASGSFPLRKAKRSPAKSKKDTTMRKILIITTALILPVAPAHAQLLGGLGGGLDGTIGGTLGGTLGGAGPIGTTVDTIRSSTSGTLRGSGETHGSQRVNRRTGEVHADRSAGASGGGDVSQVIGTPARMVGGTASGSASGHGSGSLDAQLLGIDAVRGVAQSARGAAGGATGGVLGSAGGLTSSLTGTLSGSGSASASGGGSGAIGPVTGSGETAGAGQGGFQVTRGMPVLAPDGERIGKVRQLFTDAQGNVQQMLVKVDGQTALLPAANFSASGNAVTSAMTESEIKQAAAQQQATDAPR